MIALLQDKARYLTEKTLAQVNTVSLISKSVQGFTKSAGENLNAGSTALHVNLPPCLSNLYRYVQCSVLSLARWITGILAFLREFKDQS